MASTRSQQIAREAGRGLQMLGVLAEPLLTLQRGRRHHCSDWPREILQHQIDLTVRHISLPFSLRDVSRFTLVRRAGACGITRP
jgi:hypothetical protein